MRYPLQALSPILQSAARVTGLSRAETPLRSCASAQPRGYTHFGTPRRTYAAMSALALTCAHVVFGLTMPQSWLRLPCVCLLSAAAVTAWFTYASVSSILQKMQPCLACVLKVRTKVRRCVCKEKVLHSYADGEMLHKNPQPGKACTWRKATRLPIRTMLLNQLRPVDILLCLCACSVVSDVPTSLETQIYAALLEHSQDAITLQPSLILHATRDPL